MTIGQYSFTLRKIDWYVSEREIEQYELRALHKRRKPWTDIRVLIESNAKYPSADKMLDWLRQKKADAYFQLDSYPNEERGPGQGAYTVSIVFRDPVQATLFKVFWT